jgi:hypothetical protein
MGGVSLRRLMIRFRKLQIAWLGALIHKDIE